jgi:hypothetical protein
MKLARSTRANALTASGEPMNCPIVKNISPEKCRENKAKYNSCAICVIDVATPSIKPMPSINTDPRPVTVMLQADDYRMLRKLCKVDGYDISVAVSELVRQGIRSIERHI